MSKGSSTTVAKRRRPLARMEWDKMRPQIENLYIDMDMTLQDVMQRLEEEHDFHAT